MDLEGRQASDQGDQIEMTALWALEAECGFGVAVCSFARSSRCVLDQSSTQMCCQLCYNFRALEEDIG